VVGVCIDIEEHCIRPDRDSVYAGAKEEPVRRSDDDVTAPLPDHLAQMVQ
jgi:hypothetical protein